MGRQCPLLARNGATLVPHQLYQFDNHQRRSAGRCFRPIEGEGRELTGFIQLRQDVPMVVSKGHERSAMVLPVVGGLAGLFMALIIGINGTLRRDLRKVKSRIFYNGDNESTMQPLLQELHEVVQQISETSQNVQRKLAREEASKEELESRLRDAQLGLCPSRRTQRERFTQASHVIQVSVSVDRSRFVPGTFVDLTLEEAIMALAGGAVDLAPGFPAHVRIQSAGEDQIADFVVETLNRTSVGKVCLVRLRITNPANLQPSHVTFVISWIIDESVRVRPDSRNPVAARVFSTGGEKSAMHDYSTSVVKAPD